MVDFTTAFPADKVALKDNKRSLIMHEMSYCIQIVNMTLDAIDPDKDKVEEISVSIGSMTGIVPEYLEKYFPEATKNTLLEGSVLNIHMIPVETRCGKCGESYTPSKENSYRCPGCGSTEGALIHGREFELTNLKVRSRT